VLFIRSVGGPDTSVRGLAACERAWWLEARGFGGVEGVVLRANDEPAGFSSRPPPRLRDTPTLSPQKSKRFFNCVAGAILMTWCEWLGGNVTTWCWLQSIAFESFTAQMAVTRVKSAGGKTAWHMVVTWSWLAGSQCLPEW